MRSFCWACAATSVLAFGLACGQTPGSSKEIDSAQLAKLLEQPGKVYFLDVREPFEVSVTGSVKGYVNIPMSQIAGRVNEIPRDKLIVTL
jgi:rhodanese-related sulfurtransferase